jgi:hypothetical protein
MHDLTYSRALELAEHLKALDDTVVYVRDEEGFPFDKVSKVVSGSSYRLSGPSSCYLIAEEQGLTFKLNVEFEHRDANGRGVSLFDRIRLRELMLKLPDAARASFADMLAAEVMPGMAKRSEEIRQALLEQADSEDCVRGLIAFASRQQPPA